MNGFVVLASILGAANAGLIAAPYAGQTTIQKVGHGPTQFVRAPAHDSASIEHHRLGGNFAFATAEAHAYASITPEISVATHPVAETTHVHQDAPIKTIQPGPIVRTHHAASPIFGQQDILAQQPVVGPVAQHTRVHQQLIKQQHHTVHQPIAHVAQQQVTHIAPAVQTAQYINAPVGVAHGVATGIAHGAYSGLAGPIAAGPIGAGIVPGAYGAGIAAGPIGAVNGAY